MPTPYQKIDDSLLEELALYLSAGDQISQFEFEEAKKILESFLHQALSDQADDIKEGLKTRMLAREFWDSERKEYVIRTSDIREKLEDLNK